MKHSLLVTSLLDVMAERPREEVEAMLDGYAGRSDLNLAARLVERGLLRILVERELSGEPLELADLAKDDGEEGDVSWGDGWRDSES